MGRKTLLMILMVVAALIWTVAFVRIAKADGGREPGDPRTPTFTGSYTGRTIGPWIGGNSWPYSGPGISITPPVAGDPMAAFMDWRALHVARVASLTETVIESIEFGLDRVDIEEKFASDLDAVAVLLLSNPEISLILAGHTDLSGSASHNDVLADRRADSVRNALVDRGVPAERLTTVGFGESSPLDSVLTPLRANRRVEVQVQIEMPTYLE